MADDPLVSIIIPSYNHAQFIKKAVISVYNQTYKNIEVIIIDDQSSDNTIEILKDLNKSYNFILIEQTHQGLINNLNLAIAKYSTGKYVAYCSSDDYYTPNRIEVMVNFLEKNKEYAACSSNYFIVDKKDTILNESKLGYHDYTFQDLFIKGKNLPANSLIKRELIINIGLYDPSYKLEDLYMWLKLTKLGYKIALLNDNLFYYRIHENNTINRHFFLIEETEKILKLYSSDSNYKSAVSKHYFNGYINVLNFKIIDKKAGFYFLNKIKLQYYNEKRFWISTFILLIPKKLTLLTYKIIK